MTWQALHLQLALTSDLHCGKLPLGFVARTYPFVPCHLPFFAMVAISVEILGMPQVSASYRAVEELFTTALRSSPFYIMHEGKPLFPWCSKDKEVIEARYIDSRYGVGLDWQSRSATEGQLFETEVILHTPKTGINTLSSMQATLLEGSLFFRAFKSNELELSADGALIWHDKRTTLLGLASSMRLGGNGTRCLARPCNVKQVNTNKLWGLYSLDLNHNWPNIVVDNPQEQLGPIPLEWSAKDTVWGECAVLTGRRYSPKGPGLNMEKNACIAWKEGWKSEFPIQVAIAHPRMGIAV